MIRDIEKELATIWEALEGFREDCISEDSNGPNDTQWENICHSMAVIREELNLPCEVDIERDR